MNEITHLRQWQFWPLIPIMETCWWLSGLGQPRRDSPPSHHWCRSPQLQAYSHTGWSEWESHWNWHSPDPLRGSQSVEQTPRNSDPLKQSINIYKSTNIKNSQVFHEQVFFSMPFTHNDKWIEIYKLHYACRRKQVLTQWIAYVCRFFHQRPVPLDGDTHSPLCCCNWSDTSVNSSRY